MNKHTAYDLAQMQSLPLEAKIMMSERRITEWYEHWEGKVYVSISGGKDSQVLAHIVKGLYPDVPLVFVNTGLEYDSVRLKGIELADEVLKPSMDFVSVVTKYGYPIISKEVAEAVKGAKKYLESINNNQKPTNFTYMADFSGIERREYESEAYKQLKQFGGKQEYNAPYRYLMLKGLLTDNNGHKSKFNKERWAFLLDSPFRIADDCCLMMKKKPTKTYEKQSNRKSYLGQMACESRKRQQGWEKTGCNGFDLKRPQSNPIAFWTEQDILRYIKQNKLEIAEIYGDIVYTDEDGMFYDNTLFNDYMPLTTTGAKRTGCVFCMFGITQDTDRFLKLKEAEPKKYDFVMRGGKFDDQGMWIPDKGLGYKFVIDWLNENGNLGIKY